MKLAVPKESHPQEARVAVSPETAKKFRALDLDVVVERGAGGSAGFADAAYEEAGARLADGGTALLSGADLVLKVRAPDPGELSAMRRGAALVGMLSPPLVIPAEAGIHRLRLPSMIHP